MMLLIIVLMILGFVMLILGADSLVDGASSMAKRLKKAKSVTGISTQSIAGRMQLCWVGMAFICI